MQTAHRSRRVREPMTWLGVCIALGVHGAVRGSVHALGVSVVGNVRGPSSAARPALEVADDIVDLQESCVNDVVFAASGRAALCLAPLVGDVDQCWRDAQMNLWIDLSGCQAVNDPGTAITMVEPKIAEELPPIDPEKLLEESMK